HVPPIVPCSACMRLLPALGVVRQAISVSPLPRGSSATDGSNIAVPPFATSACVTTTPAGERDTMCRHALAAPVHGAAASLLTNAISALPEGSTASAGPPVELGIDPSSCAAPQLPPSGRAAICTYCGGPLSTFMARTALPA